jgi:type II secretory ATPase GspE/PulE/Tfp pilus assembly ATPase PilB-like protein
MASTRFTINSAEREWEVVLDKPKITIGRGSHNDIIVIDNLTSRYHAVIEQVGESFHVRDKNSSNGTRLNGQKLTAPAPLHLGDVIGVGKHSIVVEFGEPRVAVEVSDETEELTADDLVDETDEGLELLEELVPEPDDDNIFIAADADLGEISPFEMVSVADDDTEAELTKLADNLPPVGFGASDVELTDGKGQTVHASGSGRKSLSDPGGAVELVRLLLMLACRARATDIHIEPRELTHGVRLRIDGIMVDITTISVTVGLRIATVVKVLCEIDIAQRKVIQEGGFAAKMPVPQHPGRHRRVDYRVSFAPAVLGQKLVIRILDSSGVPTKLDDLGLPARMAANVGSLINRESGMVLVVGPTGSGKTTTLYSLLRSINLAKRNVVTIEDPVEVHLEGITQIPVDEKRDRGFLQLLRSVLRQDPDVILVGEIRDAETARVAMQAAITGHMVFSTLHTRDTIGTIFRLRDLEVETYMLGQSLQLIIAQRLARQLCNYCKSAVKPTMEQLRAMGPAFAGLKKIYRANSCARCLGTGHWGRRAYFELLSNSDSLTRAIMANAPRDKMMQVITGSGFISLQQSAYQLVADGHVDFAEIEGDIGSIRDLG